MANGSIYCNQCPTNSQGKKGKTVWYVKGYTLLSMDFALRMTEKIPVKQRLIMKVNSDQVIKKNTGLQDLFGKWNAQDLNQLIEILVLFFKVEKIYHENGNNIFSM